MAINEKCCCCPSYLRSEDTVRYWSATQETMVPTWSRGTDNGYAFPVCYSSDKADVLCGDGGGLRFWLLDTATGGVNATFDVFGYLNAVSNQIDTAFLMSDWCFFQHDDGANDNTMSFNVDGTENTRTQSFSDGVFNCVNQGSQYLYTLSGSDVIARDSGLAEVANLGALNWASAIQTRNGIFTIEQESNGGGGFVAKTARLHDSSGLVWEQDFTENYENFVGSLSNSFVTRNERNVAGSAHLIVRSNVFVNLTATGIQQYEIPSLNTYVKDVNTSVVWVNDTDFVIYKEAISFSSTYPRLAYWSDGVEVWDVEVVTDNYNQGIRAIFADEQRTITWLRVGSVSSTRAATVHDNSDGSVLYTIPFTGTYPPKPAAALGEDCICTVATPNYHGVVVSGSHDGSV